MYQYIVQEPTKKTEVHEARKDRRDGDGDAGEKEEIRCRPVGPWLAGGHDPRKQEQRPALLCQVWIGRLKIQSDALETFILSQ